MEALCLLCQSEVADQMGDLSTSSPGSCLRASCAPRNDDRSASSLAGRPCLIIGVRECRHETGNIVRRASVEATSVVWDRARVRRLRRIRSLRISGRPAQTAAALAGACGRIASPHWGHRGADSGSFRTSIGLSEHDGHCMQPVRRAFPLSLPDSPIVQPHVPKS